MTCHLNVSANPFPIDYDSWLTTEPDSRDPLDDECAREEAALEGSGL